MDQTPHDRTGSGVHPEGWDLALFLTVKDFARLLQVSSKSVYRAVWAGQIRVAKIGSSIRIPRGEVIRLLGKEQANDHETP
jgi:excisionase family DNA binding protein